MNPYAKLITSYADVPVKQSDPWAGPRMQPAFLRNARAGEFGRMVIGNKKPMVPHPDYVGDRSDISRELQIQYPTYTDRYAKFNLLKKQLGQGNQFKLASADGVENKKNFNAFARGDTVYMKDDFPKEREFGSLLHELRHLIARDNGANDLPNPIGNRTGENAVFDSFGNQFDHMPYGYEDSDMLRSLKDLRLAQETGRAPGWALANSPWLRGGRNGALEPSDLMQHIGRITAGKR